MSDLSARRPLKSRSTGWARSLSLTLLKLGVKPNQVSTFSVVFALCTVGALLSGVLPPVLAWLLAAAGIQLRLLCNLMDGMLAVEGGLKSPHGDLFNEFPDRLADMFILASLGYAGGTSTTIALGWLAASGALMTACIRMHGASLTGSHDFQGPMAKPHRMALATGTCVLMALLSLAPARINPVPWILGVMVAGIAWTILRRLKTLSRVLHERAAAATSAAA